MLVSLDVFRSLVPLPQGKASKYADNTLSNLLPRELSRNIPKTAQRANDMLRPSAK